MAKTSVNIIKGWFETNKKPTQNQFWNWLDSFWHKDDLIPMDSVSNLETTLDAKAEQQALQTHIDDPNAHGGGGSGLVLGDTDTTAHRGDHGTSAYTHSQDPTVHVTPGQKDAWNGKLTGTRASDAEVQMSAVAPEDDKFVSRVTLFNWSISETFRGRVRGILLVGLSTATSAVITTSDSIVVALGKLQAQLSDKTVTADYESTPANTQKIPNINSLQGWKNLIAFWKSTAFAGTGSRLLTANATGQLSASLEVQPQDIFSSDADIVNACVSATFNAGNNYQSSITPVGDKVLLAGQYCLAGGKKYEAVTDNVVIRTQLG